MTKSNLRYIRLAAAVLLAAALAALLAACSRTEQVVIATDGNYHPFNFINDAGEIDGMEKEMGDELCKRADFECEWVLNDWEDMIPDVVAEEYDIILAGMSITAKREETIDFTEAYYPPTPSVYLVRAGEGDAALQGDIGATANTIYSDYFTAQDTPFTSFSGDFDLAEVLLAGEVDTVLVDHGYGVEKVAEFEGQLELAGPTVPLDRGLGMGVRKGYALMDRLEEALASMKEDGTLNALLIKWLGEDTATFE